MRKPVEQNTDDDYGLQLAFKIDRFDTLTVAELDEIFNYFYPGVERDKIIVVFETGFLKTYEET